MRECAELIRGRVPLGEWPPGVRASFLLAVHLEGETREAYKAHRTARHLRLDRSVLPPPPNTTDPVQRRCAERIRADLPRLVPLGAGSYLKEAS